MKRIIIIASAAVAAVLLAVLIILLCGSGAASVDKTNSEFLKSFGWEVKLPAIEQAQIKIPEVFDDVYENYNEIQLEAGFDLKPYSGSDAMRYTYIVTNFPEEAGEVRANVVCVQGEPVAGDIMTVYLGGFMYPLNCNVTDCFRRVSRES